MKLKYPDWEVFKYLYSKNEQDAFEALARNLFKKRYGLRDNLSYFKNHPGNEMDVIRDNGKVIGFQAKFFDKRINSANIIKSMRTAKSNYPDQTHYLIYTNMVSGIPQKDKTTGKMKKATKPVQDVEDEAKTLGLSLEWIAGNNITDEVIKDDLLYKVFFDDHSDIRQMNDSLGKINQLRLQRVQSFIVLDGKELRIDREQSKEKLYTLLKGNKHVVVSGKGGSGKSALVKEVLLKENFTGIYLWVDGERLQAVKHVDEFFNFDVKYTLKDFSDFYAEDELKIVVIDSAECIINLTNIEPLQMLIDELQAQGWLFVFTVRESFKEDLLGIIGDYFSNIEFLKIDSLSEENIRELLQEWGILIPESRQVLSRITIPFYLARYVEVAKQNSEINTLSEFRKRVWNAKIKGDSRAGRSMMMKREQCFLNIVEQVKDPKSSYIDISSLDIDAVAGLEKDEVLFNDGSVLYQLSHDIYRDWGLEMLIDTKYKINGSIAKLTYMGSSLYTLHALANWMGTLIDVQDENVWNIIHEVLDGKVDPEWEERIMASILTSPLAEDYYHRYETELCKNKYAYFNKTLRLLMVHGYKKATIIGLDGQEHEDLVAIGPGWEASINFLFTHKDDFFQGHLDIILHFLSCFKEKKDAPVLPRKQAALLALYVFELQERSYGEGSWFWLDNSKDWATLVCKQSIFIADELNVIINKTIDRGKASRKIPYYDLLTFMIGNADMSCQAALANAIPEGLFRLMEFYWYSKEEETDGRQCVVRDYYEAEHFFGINERLAGGIQFFPASGLWTCVMMLTYIHPKETTQFMIDFMNRGIRYYEERYVQKNYYNTRAIKTANGHNLILSEDFWNLYRGSMGITMPHVMECIHMAFESALLALAEDEKTRVNAKEALDLIIEKSESCSLVAIVASLVCAYPIEFFEEALWLFEHVDFFLLDQNRQLREIQTMSVDYMFHKTPLMYKERKESKEKRHRKESLETTCLELQFKYWWDDDEESKQKLEQIYAALDKVYMQILELGNNQMTAKFIMARCDMRTMKVEDTDINGAKAYQLTPTLSKEMQAYSDDAQKRNGDMMLGIGLRGWAEFRFKGEFDKSTKYLYDNQPQKALEGVRKIIKQFEDEPDSYRLPGDEGLPGIVCATLIRDYQADLKDEDLEYCCDIVIAALSDMTVMLGNTMSEFGLVMSAVPVIINKYGEKEEYANIIVNYLIEHYKYINEYSSDIVSGILKKADFWEGHFDFMLSIIEQVIMRSTDNGKIEEVTPYLADSILSFIPSGTRSDVLNEFGKVCLQRISTLWDKINKYKCVGSFDIRHAAADNVADFLLGAEEENVGMLVAPFREYMDDDERMDDLLASIFINAVTTQRYDNFWNLWMLFYASLAKEDIAIYHSNSLAIYLMVPNWLRNGIKDLLPVDDRLMDFLSKIVKDIGMCPITLYAISKHWYSAGYEKTFDFLDMIYSIVNKRADMKLNGYENASLTYLEKFLEALGSFAQKQSLSSEYKMKVDAVITFLERHSKPGVSVYRQILL